MLRPVKHGFTSPLARLRLLVLLVLVSFALPARAAPSRYCPGTCDGTGAACGNDADCDDGTCTFADTCLPGLARLVAEVLPEGPGGLNDAANGWTCGLLDCAADIDHLSFKSDYGITAIATKDLALKPGKRYLAVAEMRADAGSWGYFDLAGDAFGGVSDEAVDPAWRRVTAFVTVPANAGGASGHAAQTLFRLHADGPGFVGIRNIAILELRDYGVFLRFALIRPAELARFEAGFILRHAGDGPGYYPVACAADQIPDASCVDPALLSVVAPAGEASPWIEVSRMFGPSPAGWRVTIPWQVSDPIDGQPIDGARVAVEVAFAPDDSGLSNVWVGERDLVRDRVGIVLPEGVPSPVELLATPGFVADGIAADRAAFTPASAQPNVFKVGTFVNTIDIFDAPSTIALDGLALLAELGLNTVDYFTDVPATAEREKAKTLGLVNRFLHAEGVLGTAGDSDIDFDPAAIGAVIQSVLDAPYWAREIGEAADAGTRFAILGDELHPRGEPGRAAGGSAASAGGSAAGAGGEVGGLSFAGPLYRAAYVDWLETEGVSADELGVATLSDALPLESFGWWQVPAVRPVDPAADVAAARRYYYALRFWNEATAEVYAIARKALVARFGEVPAAHNAGTPLGGLSFQLALGSDFQAMARHRAVTGFFGEGFLSYQDDCLAWQLGAYADYVAGVTEPWREAAAARGETFPLASYLHAYRGDLGAKMLELSVRGFEWFNHYAYGPYDLSTGDGAGGLGELSRPWLERVRAGSELLARAEPWLAGAKREPASIVMLASQVDNVWSDRDGLTSEELGWHIALTQAHHPVDFMLEDEIASGLLSNPLVSRKVLIVMRKYVSVAAWSAIERWVDAGGTLILGGELATHDELGQYDQARAEWTLFFADPGGAAGSETIRWATTRGSSSFAYAGAWSELVSVVGSPIGFSDDERAVALRIPRGRGRIYALGLALGAQYRLPETTCDGTRPAALAQRPTGFSAVTREVMSDLVEAVGAIAPLRSDTATVALHRLTSATGAPLVLAIPWDNGPLAMTLTISDLVRCQRVTEVLADFDLPVTFGSLLTTLDGPALFTWNAADCAPPIDNELTPEVVEPRPTDSEGGCAGSTSPGLAGLLLSLAWRAHERSRPTRTRPL